MLEIGRHHIAKSSARLTELLTRNTILKSFMSVVPVLVMLNMRLAMVEEVALRAAMAMRA